MLDVLSSLSCPDVGTRSLELSDRLQVLTKDGYKKAMLEKLVWIRCQLPWMLGCMCTARITGLSTAELCASPVQCLGCSK